MYASREGLLNLHNIDDIVIPYCNSLGRDHNSSRGALNDFKLFAGLGSPVFTSTIAHDVKYLISAAP